MFIDAGMAGDAFERLVAAIAGLVFEARRRDEAHFERVALTLPDAAAEDIHRPDGQPPCSQRALVQAIAQAAGVPVRDATAALPVDAVGELVRLELQQACEIALPGREADWRARVHAVVAPLRAAHAVQQAPRFDALPGLVRACGADGRTRYLRCGDGADALLLVNAFGLPLDVWHELARRLAPAVRVLALDAVPAADGAKEADAEVASDPYYAGADAQARFVAAVDAVLAAEGLARCHVASWCGGAKLALELAQSSPARVASLALLAPSFAGAPEIDGEGDSAFESSLATMCQVVDRLPAAAAGMARSMQALLARGGPGGQGAKDAPAAKDGPGAAGDADGASVFALHDRVTTPWLHAPFEDGARMVAYSRQLLAFRAHRVADGAAAGDEPAAPPRLLVTGELDATTNNRRARALLSGGGALAHLELQRAGHYFVHQNAALVAPLLLDFLRHGTHTGTRHPRLRRMAAAPEPLLVSGEL
jgi:pimeloyl-ACP methyl ester carboxylesterase